MKKILLSCVTCLLAVGLLAGCDNEEEVVTPEDPNAGVVEPGGDEGGGTGGEESGGASIGSGHYIGKEVSEYVSGESYLLGMVTADGQTHYGTGEMSGYYGATTTDGQAANSYTITDVDGGVTLSTVVEGKTVYVTMAVSDGHYNLVYSETAQVLTYDSEYNTFTITTQVEVTDDDDEPADDDDEPADGEETQDPVYEDYTLFLGTYGSYSTLGWYNYAWISQSGEYPAHLYELVELSNPTSISVTGEETSVEAGKTIQLTASVTPADAYSEVVWSSSDEKVASVNESGLVTGVAVGNATITASSVTASAVSGSIVITVTEVAPLPEGMIGYFDFTGCTAAGTAISASTDLDTYWVSDKEDIYLGVRQYDTVYLGSNGSYVPSNSTECIKFGVSGTGGSIQLKFALGTTINKVVLTASGWGGSSSVSDANLTVNDVTYACSTTGEPGELTYEFTEDWMNLLTMTASARATVHSIEIYGTFDNSYDDVSSITLTAENSNLTEYESTQITVSYLPTTALLDIDTLTWSSTDSSVAKVTKNLDGALVEALASTESVTITAEAENGVKGELTFAISAADPTAPITTTITYETIMNHEAFAEHTWATTKNTQDTFSSAEGVTTAFTGFSITWYTGASGSSNGCAIYTGNSDTVVYSLRMYYGASFALSAAEGYAIDGVVLNFTGSISNFEFTNATYTTDSSNKVYTLSGPTDSESPITFANTKTSSNTFTFADAGIEVTIVNLNYSTQG